MVSKWVFKLSINGVYWDYNPLTNLLLTCYCMLISQVADTSQSTSHQVLGSSQPAWVESKSKVSAFCKHESWQIKAGVSHGPMRVSVHKIPQQDMRITTHVGQEECKA